MAVGARGGTGAGSLAPAAGQGSRMQARSARPIRRPREPPRRSGRDPCSLADACQCQQSGVTHWPRAKAQHPQTGEDCCVPGLRALQPGGALCWAMIGRGSGCDFFTLFDCPSEQTPRPRSRAVRGRWRDPKPAKSRVLAPSPRPHLRLFARASRTIDITLPSWARRRAQSRHRRNPL